MSHALTSETGSKVSKGFKKEPCDISAIKETATAGGTLLNKLGTSIPTPFARLHLFNSAFKEINSGTGRHIDNYARLASLALDMLEFIYLNGDSGEFSIIEWDIYSQSDNLRKSKLKAHKDLGDALMEAWKNGNYGDTRIYLFKFGSEIIGGSSPYSLVFTGANLNRTYPGLDSDHMLFNTEDPKSLLERPAEFRSYLYKLYKTYFASNSGALSVFGKYISDSLADDTELSKEIEEFSSSDFSSMIDALKNGFEGSQPYTELKYNKSALEISGVTMWVKDLSRISVQSDYLIAPTVETYKNYSVNGQNLQLRTPLVLTDHGLNGAKYIDQKCWNATIGLPPSDVTKAIYERKLPGSQVVYPYLRAEDFLQDSIIELGYNIQRTKFYTGLKQDTTFLLPIKKEFFKYFRPEDLNDILSVDTETDLVGNVNKVKITLMIPLVGGKKITVEKEYSGNSIIDLTRKENTFNLAFFPFFKDLAKDVKNEYDVMLTSTADIALRFFSIEDLDNSYIPKQNLGAAGITGQLITNTRTERSGNSQVTTIHTHVDRPFDLIEVTVNSSGNSASAMIIPAMKEVDTTNLPKVYTFGVDFGTTNTQISYAKSNGTIRSFGISLGDGEDIQTVYLNNHEKTTEGIHRINAGFGAFDHAHTFALREFVTSEIDDNKFPIRTAVCEVTNLANIQEPRLFGHINVGFNYSEELVLKTSGSNIYRTDLKWTSESAKAKDRMLAFFREMLLLMRNKSILDGCGRKIAINVTYPQAMNGRVYRTFTECWRKAADLIEKDAFDITFDYESIAPYYSFSRNLGINNTYVNMDIGGGSTDILYLDMQSNETLILSVLFAGNDIWGDGNNSLLAPGNNGFLIAYEKSDYYTNLTNDLKQNYQAVKDKSQNSADIISYLFKEDSKYHFKEAISSHRIMLVPILHFTALMCYLAHFVEAKEVSMPKTLSFTGMGSLYLKMLGDEEQLQYLAEAILKKCNPEDKANLRIIFADDPKKVTAEGAVTLKLANTETISPEKAYVYGVKGEDDDTKIRVDEIISGDQNNKIKQRVLSCYDKIIEILGDNEFRGCLDDMGFRNVINSIPPKDKLLEFFENSYTASWNAFKKEHGNDNPDTPVRESLFFWPLKDGLFSLGKILG